MLGSKRTYVVVVGVDVVVGSYSVDEVSVVIVVVACGVVVTDDDHVGVTACVAFACVLIPGGA